MPLQFFQASALSDEQLLVLGSLLGHTIDHRDPDGGDQLGCEVCVLPVPHDVLFNLSGW